MASAQEVLENAKAYADGILSGAKQSIYSASQTLNNVWIPDHRPSFNAGPAPEVTVFDGPPTSATVDLVAPDEPDTTLSMQDISALEIGLIPEFAVVAPTFQELTKPAQLAEFLAQAPAISTNIAFPSVPSELLAPLPAPPLVPDRTAPAAPSIGLPDMDTLAPVFDGVAPGDLQGTFNNAYRGAAPVVIAMVDGYVDAQLAKLNPRFHEQMARIEAQLVKYLEGGTGMKPEVEDAIYSRAREKNDVEAARVRSAAYTEAASRGFTLPGGALMSAVARARQEAANNNLKASSDIVVMQAEMEQKNLQFAVSASASLRSTVVNATLSYMQNLVGLNGQALDCAKELLGATIEVYNAQVKAFSVRLEAYRAEAAYYELKLKGALAKIEVYRGEITAMEQLVNIDQLRVATHRSRIESLSSLATLYRSQVEATASRAGLEKLKLDLFSTQVQAHSAQVQAKNAEWQGYSAQIAGQNATAGLYAAQAGAYNTRLEGIKVKVGAQVEVIKAQVATNQARIEQVRAATEVFSTVAQTRTALTTSRIDLQKQELSAYSESLKAQVASAQWGMDRFKTLASFAIDSERIKVDAYKVITDTKLTRMKALADVGVAGASIEGSLAGAAMSGINSLAVLTETI